MKESILNVKGIVYNGITVPSVRSIDKELNKLEDKIDSKLAVRDRLSKRYKWRNAKSQKKYYRKW